MLHLNTLFPPTSLPEAQHLTHPHDTSQPNPFGLTFSAVPSSRLSSDWQSFLSSRGSTTLFLVFDCEGYLGATDSSSELLSLLEETASSSLRGAARKRLTGYSCIEYFRAVPRSPGTSTSTKQKNKSKPKGQAHDLSDLL